MIYYPMSVLMLAGIRDILIVSSPHDMPSFQRLFGDGASLGISVSYAVQTEPRGLADAFLVGESFVGGDPVTLILGDNIFYGAGFKGLLRSSLKANRGCTVFGYTVDRPQDYGVASFDSDGRVVGIVEKPDVPPSSVAVTGLYAYDGTVCSRARDLRPSRRGELEITDLNVGYLEDAAMDLVALPRGFAWLDTGTHESLMEASQFIRAIENRQGLKIGCIEEVAYRNGWIDGDKLLRLAGPLSKTGYGQYLERLLA